MSFRVLITLAALSALRLPLAAAPSIPAQPADPSQARPAVPVNVDDLAPGRSATSSTNAPPATPIVPGVSIIAESSLKLVLQELAQTWADNQNGNPQLPMTLTNSATILAKVQSGAPFDVVISANPDDLKTLTDHGVLLAEGQRSLARNSVVIYGRKAVVKDDDLDWFDLASSQWRKIALGKPDLVASGGVAQHALQKHGLLDDDHKDSYVYAMTDTLVLAVVQRGQADAAFAFKTDAARMNLNGFDIFPLATDDAPPVFYVAAICRLAKDPALARGFVDFCGSADAKSVWAKYGFETN